MQPILPRRHHEHQVSQTSISSGNSLLYMSMPVLKQPAALRRAPHSAHLSMATNFMASPSWPVHAKPAALCLTSPKPWSLYPTRQPQILHRRNHLQHLDHAHHQNGYLRRQQQQVPPRWTPSAPLGSTSRRLAACWDRETGGPRCLSRTSSARSVPSRIPLSLSDRRRGGSDRGQGHGLGRAAAHGRREGHAPAPV